MKTKLRFLFVVLTMLWWGANFAWGDTHTYVLSGETKTDPTSSSLYTFSTNSRTLTIANASNKVYGTQSTYYVKYSNGVQYTIAGVPNTEKITSVAFTGFPNDGSTSDNCYIGEFNGSPYSFNSDTNDFNNATSISTKTVTFSSLNILSGGFTFTPREVQLDFIITITTEDIPTYTTTINVEDLCYEHRYYASDLDRDVAGFIIAPSSGVQSYNDVDNNVYKLLVDNYATLTIGPNSDNSDVKIIRIRIGLEDGTYITVDNDALGSVACTNTSGSQKGVTSIEITTNGAMTSSRITPVLTFSPANGRYEKGTPEQSLADLSTGTLRTTPTAFRLNYLITTNGTGTTATYHLGDKYLGITPGANSGSEILTAYFSGNTYFNAASATYNITIYGGTYSGTYSVPTTETVDGQLRNMVGKYEFTGAGDIPGGTVIDDVPGISMTIGKTGENWKVIVASSTGEMGSDFTKTETSETWDIGYAAVIDQKPNARPNPTTGCFYTFKPYVNGELTIHYYTLSKAYMYVGSNKVEENGNNRIQDMTLIVEAGKTYTLLSNIDGTNRGLIWLNNFTFRPTFLLVDGSGDLRNPLTEQSKESANPFPGNLSIGENCYPHLITSSAGEGMVKFGGDRDVVNLYTNNNVKLLDDTGGTPTLIKGTVLHPEDNERTLFTYYYLQSTILKLATTNPTTLNGSAIIDNAYVDNPHSTPNPYVFTFNQNILSTSEYKVYVRINDGVEIPFSTNGWTSAPSGEEEGTQLTVNLQALGDATEALTDGTTYRIRIPAGSVCAKENSVVKNAEIIRTFTVKKAGDAPLSLVYPTGTATVGTSIVLETSAQEIVGEELQQVPLKDKGNRTVSINDGEKVTGILSEVGGTGEMSISATFSNNRLIFKPTSALKSNTEYKLTVAANQVIMNLADYTNNGDDNDKEAYTVSQNKAFFFTTGAAAGTAPRIVSTSPAMDSKVSSRTGYISFTFDQEVDLELYSEILATPINGSESTAMGESNDLSDVPATTLRKVSGDGKTICFPYGEDGLKYDLYYQVVLPANTVAGVGGKPNESYTLKFKVAKKSGTFDADDKDDFYPHTWDFCKLGSSTTSGKTAYEVITSANKQKEEGTKFNHKNTIFQSTDDKTGHTIYTSKKSDNNNLFDQGADVYIATASDATYTLPEFEGIRLSLKNANTGRFELRNITSVETSNKNADGTDKWIFRMNGNTHYMTLSKVPAGKLYMVVNTPYLGINSPNATFANVAGATIENKGTLMNTNGTKKVVINVATAGDVSFCVKNFNCEKIAVSDYSKTFKSAFAVNGKSYATDCVDEGIRHDLVNAFTDDNVKAYYVSATSENIATATELTETTTSTAASKGGEGVIVVLQKAVGDDTEIPFFVTDVNTAINTSDNLLKGTTTEINDFDNSQKNKYFFSNVYTQLSKDETELGDAPEWITTTQMGFYRAVGSKVSAHKAWLEVPTSGGSARQYYLFKFFDDGETPTAIDGVETKTVNDDAWYSLQGVRVTNPVKGNLYIHNGKKVVIK